MNFFIPQSSDQDQMERIYGRIQQRLQRMEYGPFYERVYQLVYRRNGHLLVDTVGDLCPISKETVIAILRNDRGFLICSYSCGAVGGEPIVINEGVVESVTLFDK